MWEMNNSFSDPISRFKTAGERELVNLKIVQWNYDNWSTKRKKNMKNNTGWSIQELCCLVTQSCLTPWTVVHQASLSFTISQSLLKLISTESTMLSNPLLLLPSIFPSIRVFFQWVSSCDQCIGAPASVSVLPLNIQSWLPLGLTSLISFLSKGLSRVFSNITVQKHQFFDTGLFLWSNSQWVLASQFYV